MARLHDPRRDVIFMISLKLGSPGRHEMLESLLSCLPTYLPTMVTCMCACIHVGCTDPRYSTSSMRGMYVYYLVNARTHACKIPFLANLRLPSHRYCKPPSRHLKRMRMRMRGAIFGQRNLPATIQIAGVMSLGDAREGHIHVNSCFIFLSTWLHNAVSITVFVLPLASL